MERADGWILDVNLAGINKEGRHDKQGESHPANTCK